MKRYSSPRGLTLIEIIVATVIFALAIGGLVNLFVAAKRLTVHERSRMQASELAKQFLAPLQMQVRQDQWGANCLSGGACAPGVWVLAPITYNAAYNAVGIGGTTLRRVDVIITWNEPN